MISKSTPATGIQIHPDGSVTVPEADWKIIQSALLWARIGAEEAAKSCAALSEADWMPMESRAGHGRNAAYHAQRAAQAADLEERFTAAQLSARKAVAR